MGASGDTVWIPAVPTPLMGWRTDTCSCGRRFRGRGRRRAYEIHWRVEHEDPSAVSSPKMAVTRADADAIYAEVGALMDSPEYRERWG